MADSKTPEPEKTPPPLPRPPTVPDELLKKLHEADQRFSDARHHREDAIDASSPATTEREAALEEVREAEQQVEKITDEIDRDLHPPK